MPTTIDISEGRTNDYLIHGVFLIIAGGILFLAHWSVTVMLFLLAIALFQVRSGIEIDVAQRKVRVYKALGRWRSGEWTSCGDLLRIELRYTNESQVMNYSSISTNVRVRTYDLVLVSGAGERIFHDFTDYVKARKVAGILAKEWELPLADEVQVRRQRALTNADTRRR